MIEKEKEFPIISKSIFMENFDTINTVGISAEDAFKVAEASEQSRNFSTDIGDISVGLSSGTSGNRGLFLNSKKEKAIWVGAILDRVIGFSFKNRKVAFFLRANNNLYESVNSNLLSFKFFDIKENLKDNIESFIQIQPNVLVAQPSVLLEIAKYMEHQNIDSFLSKVISVAEVLEEDQKVYFEQIFGCKIDQVYQCTEGFLAYTCKENNLHFNEDWIEIEKKYLDTDKTRFHPIITDFLRESQPVIRYELNDIIHEGKLCTCGSKSTVIEKIEGRSDDVFEFKTTNKSVTIFPDFLRRAIMVSSNNILNYALIRKGKKLIWLHLESRDITKKEEDFKQVKKSLDQLFLDFGIKNIIIEPFTLDQDRSSKFTRIKNEYKKSI